MDEQIIRVISAALALEGIPDKQIRKIVATVRKLHKQQIGDKLIAVLDEYYRRYDAGERVKLAWLAQDARVNPGSLRQAKVRYDIERRKYLSTGGTINNGNNSRA